MFKEERGLASIVIVSVLVVLITLITLGFARIMNRTVSNASNHALSTAATYGAQSALNDVATYIKTNPNANSSTCNGAGSLIGSSSAPGPFYNDSDLSSDGSRSIQLTCLLLDPTPNDLVFQNNPEQDSRIVRLNTTPAQAKLLISWQATDPSATNIPPGPKTNLYDETTWNNKSYTPILRLTLYPATVLGDISNMQANSRTIFLYPDDTSSNTPLDYNNMQDGHIYNVHCNRTIQAGSFNGTPDYLCNVVISNLLSPSPTPEYYYVRLTPIYNKLDIKIKANDSANKVLSFQSVQALVDVTTQSGGVSKRLQARVNTSSSGSSNLDVSPDSNAIPEQSIRSATTLCKRYNTDLTFLSIDDISGTCSAGSNITFTPPTVDLVANPTTIAAGQASNLTWTSQYATNCAAQIPPSPLWTNSTAANSPAPVAVYPNVTTTYTIKCFNTIGQSAQDSETVTVVCPSGFTGIPPNCTLPGGGGGGGGGGGTGCPDFSPSPGVGAPEPDPCVRGVIFAQWNNSTTIAIKIYASHCYASLSASPGSLSGGWIRSPSDNSDWYDYTVSGFPNGGGNLTITCTNDTGSSASLTIYIPPGPSPPPASCSNGATNPPACNSFPPPSCDGTGDDGCGHYCSSYGLVPPWPCSSPPACFLCWDGTCVSDSSKCPPPCRAPCIFMAPPSKMKSLADNPFRLGLYLPKARLFYG
jgi:hypothetical protein